MSQAGKRRRLRETIVRLEGRLKVLAMKLAESEMREAALRRECEQREEIIDKILMSRLVVMHRHDHQNYAERFEAEYLHPELIHPSPKKAFEYYAGAPIYTPPDHDRTEGFRCHVGEMVNREQLLMNTRGYDGVVECVKRCVRYMSERIANIILASLLKQRGQRHA